MKKIILLIVITVSSIIFVSCGKSKDVLKRALAGDVITYQSGDSALFVTKDITLQTQTTIDNKEVIFSWSSSSPAISENGKVTRPFSSFDTNVVLTVSASYNKSTRNKTFNLVVKKVNIEEALSIGYHNGDNAHSVTQNVTLPHIIQKDGYTAQVVWESYNSLILANDGTLNPDLIGSVDAVLKATVYGTEGQIFTKMFSLRVIGITLDLEIIYSNNENSTNVKHNLNLPESVFIKGEEHSVKWTSTKPDIISNTGIVNRPFGAPVTTTLGATINNTNMSWFIRYEVTVLGINTSLVEQNTNIIYKEGDTPQTITSNITLVKSAVIDDCLITFSYITDNENVIDANGNVTRRKTDSLVTMYVSAASGTHTYTFSYNLKVLKEEYEIINVSSWEEVENITSEMLNNIWSDLLYHMELDLEFGVYLNNKNKVNVDIFSFYDNLLFIQTYASFLSLLGYTALPSAGENVYVLEINSLSYVITLGVYDGIPYLLLENLTLGFPYDYIENVLQISIKGLIPSVFDGAFNYSLNASEPLFGVSYNMILINIFDYPKNLSSSFEDSLLLNGFEFFIVTNLLEENVNIYSITTEGKILYITIHYYEINEAYTIGFWVIEAFNPNWEEIKIETTGHNNFNLDYIPNIIVPNVTLFSVSFEQIRISVNALDILSYYSWIEAFSQNLINAGFTYNDDYLFFVSPDNSYIVRVAEEILQYHMCIIYIEAAPDLLYTSFPYSSLDAVLGVNLEDLLPDIFDDATSFNTIHGDTLNFMHSNNRYIYIYDFAQNYEQTFTLYASGLEENGFGYYGYFGNYMGDFNVYFITLENVSLFVGFLYAHEYSCYILAFWVISNENILPYQPFSWDMLIDIVASYTFLDLSDIIPFSWENTFIDSSSYAGATIILKNMEPSYFETWVVSYTESLIEIGFIYDITNGSFVSSNGIYSITIYDTYDLYGYYTVSIIRITY